LKITRTGEGIFISQKRYVLDLIKECDLVSARPLRLPLGTHVKLTPQSGALLSQGDKYRRLIGKSIYLTMIRPDISFTVLLLSQFMQAPTIEHMKAALDVVRYLKSFLGQGILLANNSAAQLTAFCDLDWASCPTIRKSTTGYCILLGQSPISWKTKKQNCGEVQY